MSDSNSFYMTTFPLFMNPKTSVFFFLHFWMFWSFASGKYCTVTEYACMTQNWSEYWSPKERRSCNTCPAISIWPADGREQLLAPPCP